MTARPPAVGTGPVGSGRRPPNPRASGEPALDPPTVRLSRVDPATSASAPDAPTEVIPVVDPAGRPANGGLGDGLALSLSSAVGSLAGFLSWLIAARIMPQSEFGQASAVVSAFILIAGAAQLNLGIGLLRWLPASGRRAGRLVWSSLLLIMPLSGLVGLIYVLFVPELAETAAGPGGSFGVGVLLFVLAAAGWGVFVVHDFILVAIGKPWWTVWRNGLFAVVRIGLLVALGYYAGLGAQGVVLSWVGPIVVWILVGSLVVAVYVRRFSRRATGGTLPERGEAVRFLGPTAVAQVGTALLYNQVTLLVTLRFGPETGAAFFVAWQAVTVVDIAAMFFMNSLAVHVAREPHRAGELAAAARTRLLKLFLPVLALGALLARPVLSIFGSGYAEASVILQLLMLGLAFRLVVAHALGVRQAAGKAMQFARLQLISTLLVLLVVVVIPVRPGAPDEALLPVAIGYVVVQVVCALTVLFSPARRRAESPVSPATPANASKEGS
ncbi:lipopolysaccharide biosynthesis protein [Pseudonocardia acidicola]|uniref:Lipopolysaccharide biosynthesis protein n=1 Tax=Pseudonocardia acidicola TaxID=2724939 RepID=A0ABX1SPR1_9PSEU|nr:lipopolysaccharide biosynthesis protein [Pseudonocardia acidicola]NMI02305.1 lipopolysaccharide biosynthesis protein [Pseudonocardia acidicola]